MSDKKVYNHHCFNSEHQKSEVNGCEYCGQRGHLEFEEGEEITECPFPGKNRLIKKMGQKLYGGPVTKMTKQQIRADRTKRATTHFKKEIYPDMERGSMEEKHFTRKFKK